MDCKTHSNFKKLAYDLAKMHLRIDEITENICTPKGTGRWLWGSELWRSLSNASIFSVMSKERGQSRVKMRAKWLGG